MTLKNTYEKKCLSCDEIFITSYKPAKTCCDNCKYTLRRKNNLRQHECKHCYNLFNADKQSFGFCSSICRKIYESHEKYIGKQPGIDFVECPVCTQYVRQISPRHAKIHGFSTPNKLAQAYNCSCTCQNKKDNKKGELNPAYNHNGKYSKWSKNFIHGYDENAHILARENHSKFMNDPINKCLFPNCIEYWLKETNGNEKLAKQLHLKSQLRDLKYFVEKYGDIEGQIRHKLKTERWMATLAAKSPEEICEINRKKIPHIGSRSKAEIELADILRKSNSDLQIQFKLFDIDKNKWYVFDIQFNDKIIEYNGDYWHANPNKFKHDDIIKNGNSNISAAEKWEIDKIRNKVANAYGYEIMTIWEHDYKQNKEKVIKECLDFLNR